MTSKLAEAFVEALEQGSSSAQALHSLPNYEPLYIDGVPVEVYRAALRRRSDTLARTRRALENPPAASPFVRVPFCPRPGIQKRLGDKAWASGRMLISSKSCTKNFTELRAERAPICPLGLALFH